MFESVIVPKLHHLAIVLAAAQDPQPSPEVKIILRDMRKVFGDQFTCIHGIISSSGTYAKTLAGMLSEVLPFSQDDFEAFTKGTHIHTKPTSLAEKCDTAMKGMEKLREGIPSTVQCIVSALKDDNTSMETLVFTGENTQVVNDLIKATDDISAILRQINEYFLSLGRYLEDTEPFFTGSPSDEEKNVMRERWNGFSAAIGLMQESLPGIYTEIMMGPNIEGIKQFSRWGKHTPGAASKPERPTDSIARKAYRRY